jgi:antitoxin VapB
MDGWQVVTLSIRDPETDRLARELSRRTGETMIQAIRRAVEERLARLDSSRAAEVARRRQAIDVLVRRSQSLPILDTRSEDELLGYDEHGIPS